MKMTDERNRDETELEALFVAERANPPVVSDALMQRILVDADTLQSKPLRNPFTRLFRALGGAPGMGGLVTATCVGFWLGFAPPQGLPDVAGQLMGIEQAAQSDVADADMVGFGWDIEEG